MEKIEFKPGNMLYPVPAVMVSCGTMAGEKNIITIAWTGTVCSDPPMVYISVRKSRYSHEMILKNKEFVINLTTSELAFAADYCGVKSGRDIDKFEKMKLTPVPASKIDCPMINESPVNIECTVVQVLELGSHDMFIAEVLEVNGDKSLIDENGKFELEKAGLIGFSHDGYHKLGKFIGRLGYSVMKKSTKKKLMSQKTNKKTK